MRIAYYFLDDWPYSGKLSYINTDEEGYVEHDEKTVTIKVYLSDIWGADNGSEYRKYPRKGFEKGFKREKKKPIKEKQSVEPWVLEAMKKNLENRFPDIGKNRINFERK